MSDSLFGIPLIPVASENDAETTCKSVLEQVHDRHPTIHVVHVIEKTPGAPDKASIQQRTERAERIFRIAESMLAGENVAVETHIVYGTDVSKAILDQADEVGATAIVFTPRKDNRWMKLLTGDVAQKLMVRTDHPLVVLPRVDSDE